MIRKDAVSISMEAASFCGFDIVPIGFCFIYLHKIVRMKHVLVVLLLVGAAITGCKKNKNANVHAFFSREKDREKAKDSKAPL